MRLSSRMSEDHTHDARSSSPDPGARYPSPTGRDTKWQFKLDTRDSLDWSDSSPEKHVGLKGSQIQLHD
jgi:hypothetical protein